MCQQHGAPWVMSSGMEVLPSWGAAHTEFHIPHVCLLRHFLAAGVLSASVTEKTILQKGQQPPWVLSSSAALQEGWKGTCHSWSKQKRSCLGTRGNEAYDVREKLGG